MKADRRSILAMVVLVQLGFTGSDVLARAHLKAEDDFLASLFEPWFLAFVALRQVATLGQLFVLANIELGRAAGFFAMGGLVLTNVIGVAFLGDALSAVGFIGVALALASLVALTLSGDD